MNTPNNPRPNLFQKGRFPSRAMMNRPIPPRRIIPPKRPMFPGKNIPPQETKKQKKIDWNLKGAGKAILIAAGLMLIQIISMLFLNLKPLGAFLLGLFLLIIFGITIYFLLDTKTNTTENTKKV